MFSLASYKPSVFFVVIMSDSNSMVVIKINTRASMANNALHPPHLHPNSIHYNNNLSNQNQIPVWNQYNQIPPPPSSPPPPPIIQPNDTQSQISDVSYGASELKEELQALQQELKYVKARKYQRNWRLCALNEYDEDLDLSNIQTIQSNHLHHLIYPKTMAKQQLVDPHKDYLRWLLYNCIWLCFCIFLGLIMLLYAMNRLQVGNSFDIKGTCICKRSPKTCDTDDDEVYSCTWENIYVVGNLPVCDGIKDQYSSDYTYRDTNQDSSCTKDNEYTCYTNENCSEIFLDENNSYIQDARILFVIGGFLILCVCCLCAVCHRVYEYRHPNDGLVAFSDWRLYYNGSDKELYYEHCWNDVMTFEQNLDYLLSYYRRRLKVRIQIRIERLILHYKPALLVV